MTISFFDLSGSENDLAKIGSLRKQLNLTQAAFAREAQVSQSLIAKIEAGRIDPTYSKVCQIQKAIERLTRKNEQSVKEVMNMHVVTVSSATPVVSIAKLMNAKSISQVPIVDNHKMVGLITEREIVESITKEAFRKLKARDVMIETPPVVSQETKVSIIRSLMVQYPIVIVAKNGVIVGIVTKSDLIRHAL